ncbi:MAG: hypothetical protein WBN22_01105 [Verrucomicrobiia bacterium]
MNARDFFLTLFAVAIGTTIALAIAGLYLKSQLSTSAGSGTLGTILSLFTSPAAAPGATSSP